jgi:pilus assembly protein CpaB
VSSRTVLVVALALVCGGAAAVGVNILINEPAAAGADTVPVVVAAVDISRGVTVSADLVKTRACPKELVPAGAITTLDEAVGRVAYLPLVKDEPVLDAKLAVKGAGRGLAALTVKGMRTFTIQTTTVASAAAGFILPGDRVDVLLTVKSMGGEDGTGGGTTTRLLQNIEVVAVDQRLSAPAENKVDPNELRSVTLSVTPDQDAMLALAQTMGTLHLSLRNAMDKGAPNSKPVTLADLRLHQEKPRKEPSAATATPTPVTVTEPPRRRRLGIRTLRGTVAGWDELPGASGER